MKEDLSDFDTFIPYSEALIPVPAEMVILSIVKTFVSVLPDGLESKVCRFSLLNVALPLPVVGVSVLSFSKFATTVVLAARFEILRVALVSEFTALFTVQFLNL